MGNPIYQFKYRNDTVYQPKATKPPRLVYHMAVGAFLMAGLMISMYSLSVLVFAIMGVDQ
jgi:hypothetical protein